MLAQKNQSKRLAVASKIDHYTIVVVLFFLLLLRDKKPKHFEKIHSVCKHYEKINSVWQTL